MKQKTMDQELMAVLNKEAQDEEKRRFEEVRLVMGRLDDKRKVGTMFHGILRSVVRTEHRHGFMAGIHPAPSRASTPST